MGVLILLGGIFQCITAVLIYQGERHYILRIANRKVGMIIYAIFAILLFYLAYWTFTMQPSASVPAGVGKS
jgi:high-affinity Fe2+/Pb2+ permease